MCDRLRILSIDLEDWYHLLEHDECSEERHWHRFESRVERNTRYILDCLDQYDQKATFFVLGYIARKHPELVLEIAERGHEIGTHGDQHKLVYQLSKAEFEKDLLDSMQSIERASGKTPSAFRAPGFSVVASSTWAFDVLAENGITTDGSIYLGRRAHGGLVEAHVTEPFIYQTTAGNHIKCFPVSRSKLGFFKFTASGGGYFRLCPTWLWVHLLKTQQYSMTYFHPRDFDVDQPVMSGLSPIRRFKAYTGLRSARAKFQLMLARFNFSTVNQSASLIDESNSPILCASDFNLKP